MRHDHHDELDKHLDDLRRSTNRAPRPEFLHALETRVQDHFLHTTPMSSFVKNFFHKPILWIPSAAVVTAAVVAIVWFQPWIGKINRTTPGYDKLVIQRDVALDNFTLTATKSDSLGASTDTAFLITSKTKVALADVKSSVAISPEVPFTVTSKGDTQFTITPGKELTAGKVYQVSLGSKVQAATGSEKKTFSWAIQTKKSIDVDGTLPRDKATGVPIDTGIEVTFTTDRIKDLDKHFTITPTVAGRFEQHGRVFSFIPKDRLAASTLYTVTVSKGLPTKDSSVTLDHDTTFRFETVATNDGSSVAGFDRAFTAVRPDEAPVIDYNSYGTTPDSVKATVYKFANADDLMQRFATLDHLPTWAYMSRQIATIDPKGLTKVGEYPLATQANALAFPQGFPVGYYLVEIPSGKQTAQTALVVSDLAVSVTTTTTTSALWAYDLVTGKPLAGATIQSTLDKAKAVTDVNGVAQIPTPAEFLKGDPAVTRSYITVSDGARSTLAPIVPEIGFGMFRSSGYAQYTASNADYWSYLWSDRTLYRPDDTINLWGVARNRKQPKSEDVTVEVWTWSYVDGNSEYIPLVRDTVKTSPFSTFNDKLKLTQLKPGFYTLSAKIGGQTVASRSFEVRTFQKPAYQIVVTPSELIGVVGDTVTYKVHTEFFDGTPAPRVNVAYSGDQTSETISTDEQGNAEVKLALPAVTANQYTNLQQLYFRPAESAEGDLSTTTSVMVLPSRVTFSPTATVDGTTANLNLTLRAVDFTKASQGWWYEPPTGEPIPNASLTGKVIEIVTTKTKTGVDYDFVEKRAVDTYNYSWNDAERSTFTGTTDANGKFSKTFTLTGEQYRIEVTAKDAQGKSITRSAYVSRSNAGYAQTSTAFSVGDDAVTTVATSNTNAYQPPPKYAVGDATTVSFRKNSEVVSKTGKFLFLKLQNGLKDVAVSDSPRLPVTFVGDDAPIVYYTAIWFDGTTFRAPDTFSMASLQFDEQTRKLNVSVKPTKSTYAPGDTVHVDVTVTDPKSQPVQAAVNLSAIDEALNAIQYDNAPSPLTSLYSNVMSGMMQLYVSHEPLRASMGAEGGGGGDGARKDFKDAVLFTEVQTNASGKASAEFKLPDNITSWRLTGQAVSDDLYAGDTTVAVPVTKPLFGTLTMNDEYVVADHPTVLARADGAGLKANDAVSFTFEVVGLGAAQQRTGKAFTTEAFVFPKLTSGEHQVKLTVSHGKDRDTLVRTITVVPSRLTSATSTFVEAKVGTTLSGSTSERSTVIVSDLGRGRVINGLESLQWSWGKRIERSLAARISSDLLTSLDVQSSGPSTGFSPLTFQQDDGGISQVVYGSSDLQLSAFAAARADLFDQVQLRRYFVGKLEQKSASLDQVGYALLGLANLGEPVLPDLESYLTQKGITDEQRLVASLAFQSLGANDRATTIAADLLAKHGETQDPFIRLKLGATNDAIIVNTARMSILAEGLKLPERLGLAAYLNENFPKDTITNLERALAYRAAVPLLDDQAVTLRYTVGSNEQTVALNDEHRSRNLSLTSVELAAFRVTGVDGPVGLTVQSVAPLNVSTVKKDDRLSLARSYSIVGAKGRAIQQGDLVRIDFTPHVRGVLDHDYLLTDELPSGLVLVSRPWEHGVGFEQDINYPIEVNGQRLTFYSSGNSAFHYYARVLIPGGYQAEPAILQGLQSRDLVNYSGAQNLEIK